MRADRLLSILLLLQTHRRLTASTLAHRLEVCERTIYRDMEALSTAGVPVRAERGTGGGWSILEEYQTNLTGLTEGETRALFLTRPVKLLTDLGLDKAADVALVKLLAALPAAHRPGAEDVRQRIHLDAAGWRRFDERFPVLPTLQTAVFADRNVELTYRTGDGVTLERRVAPLGLVAKGKVWYLLAQSDEELRTYRVSRVEDARISDAPFTRPPDFDLAAAWEQSSADFVNNLPRYPATLRVRAGLLPRLRQWRFARLEQSEPDVDGWVRVTMRFEVEEEAVEYVLSLGPRIEVVEPATLRARVAEFAVGVSALYRRESAPDCFTR